MCSVCLRCPARYLQPAEVIVGNGIRPQKLPSSPARPPARPPARSPARLPQPPHARGAKTIIPSREAHGGGNNDLSNGFEAV
ncbi:hypothetical protein E2C01_083552 [Portunus trituberculatus]|uniref:Uncharacterized protein n=1 Tax=Portunus trituberculatus TaxID=210409 RepID=A0A5B7J3T8_PORTR|nr:hypothetical protein [Portunus trituberculatus]